MFAGRGAAVVDADAVAREVVAPGEAGLQRLVDEWGTGLLTPAGTLDRDQLRASVFADPAMRQRLDAILHPLIRERLFRQLAEQSAAPYGMAVVPLLLESGWREAVARVAVVDLPEAAQRERARRRDGLPDAQIRAIMAAQIDRTGRLAAADDVIDNSGPLAALAPQVERLHRQYLRLA
jgi:dephospho-CoA kinase